MCPKLYKKHKGKFIVDNDTFLNSIPECDFTQDEIETIEQVLQYYGDKESQWLSELTHKEDPWKNARVGYSPGERCQKVINKEDIQAYYTGLL